MALQHYSLLVRVLSLGRSCRAAVSPYAYVPSRSVPSLFARAALPHCLQFGVDNPGGQ